MKSTSQVYNIVTSTTPEYLEGVIALNNSLHINFPNSKLTVLTYAKGTNIVKILNKVAPDISVIEEAKMLGPIIAEGVLREGLPIGPDMYSRLLIPKYLSGKVFYVDADCLVLQPLDELWELDLHGYASASVYRPDIDWEGGHLYDDMGSGTVFMDCDKWNKLGLTEQCFKIMEDHLSGDLVRDFHVNVESVISYAHQGNFIHLPSTYQNLAYYGTLCKEDKIIHYGGPKPWMQKDTKAPLNYKELWQAYYVNNLDKIKLETAKLPERREQNMKLWRKI